MDTLYQVLMIGLRGTTLTHQEKLYLTNYSPGGIILFNRNIIETSQLVDLCASIYEFCEIPPFIAIDQEGGLVDRMRAIIGTTPSASELKQSGSLKLSEEYGVITGETLNMFGINLNFAPVVDIQFSEADNALRQRYWGNTVEDVIELTSAYLEGLNSTGVLGCLKHFPGLGNTYDDSHFVLPTNEKTFSDLWKEDLLPYREMLNLSSFVMISHCHFKDIDPDNRLPASVSENVYTMLREKIGFSGIAITDDLSMGGIHAYYPCRDLIAKPLQAGADFLPICNDYSCIDKCFDYLRQIRDTGAVSRERIEDAITRILSFKAVIPQEYTPAPKLDYRIEKLKQRMSSLRLELIEDE